MSEAYAREEDQSRFYPPYQGEPEYKEPPHNIEAEQALIGAIFINNDAFDEVSDILRPGHFYEPLHARLYDAIEQKLNAGEIATPVTMKSYFDEDPGLKEVNGAMYLARLAAAATTIMNVREYAKTIRDMSMRRDLVQVAEEMQQRAHDAPITDPPKKQLEDAEAALFRIADQRSDSGMRHAVYGAAKVIETIERMAKGEATNAMSTGFQSLDELIGPQDRGDLMIIGGAPSMGKTALVQSICLNNALAGKSIAYFSFEMSEEKLARRYLSMISGVPVKAIRHGNLSEQQVMAILDAEKHLKGLQIHLDASRDIGTSQIRSRARRVKRNFGLDILVVDYIQITQSDNPKDRKDLQIAQITRDLLRIGGELDCNVLALSQLSRQVQSRENKRPLLSDLRESGAIEQDARAVIFCHREEYYLQRDLELPNWHDRMDKARGRAEIIVAKNSEGDGAGSVMLDFDGPRTLFKEPVYVEPQASQEDFDL